MTTVQPFPSMRGDGHRLRLDRRTLLVAGAGIVAAAAAPVVLRGERLASGTMLAGIDVGGRRPADAIDLLRERMAAFERNPVVLRHGERSWTPAANELGLAIDYDATVAVAGRTGATEIGGRLRSLFDPAWERRVAPVAIRIDEARLRGYLDRMNGEVSTPPRDARLVVDGAVVTVVGGQAGTEIDRDAAIRSVVRSLEGLVPADVVIPLASVPPTREAADLADAARQASALLAGPVILHLWERSWLVEPADLVAALVLPDGTADVAPRLEPDRLLGAARRVAAEIDHPPANATLGWDGGVVVVDPGYAGTRVDVGSLATVIAEAASSESRSAEVPVTYEPAALRGDNLERLGIVTRLAVGSSSFAGSSVARATNVGVATDRLGPALVPPGGAFSFNETIGPITIANGYVEGKIILGDWFASDLGGGVCQVSTTVFRAALLAGLPFVEWHPHSFRLGFYELDGWPPGMDAAIYQSDEAGTASLDLRFANPTDGWLLLQLHVEGNDLVAELYGPSTGYEVRLGDPEFGDSVPPPPPIERREDGLAAGSRETVQQPQPGITVRVHRRVIAGGAVLAEDTFVSPYRPQAEVVLVGVAES